MTGISGFQASGYTASVFSEKNVDAKARISFENALAAARFENSEIPTAEMSQVLPQSPTAIQAPMRGMRRPVPTQQVLQGLQKLIQSNQAAVKPSLDILQ